MAFLKASKDAEIALKTYEDRKNNPKVQEKEMLKVCFRSPFAAFLSELPLSPFLSCARASA